MADASPASRSNHRNGAISSPKPEELIVDCGLVMLNTSSGFACSHGGSGALVLFVRSGRLWDNGAVPAGAAGVAGCATEAASYTICLPLLAAISSLTGSGRADLECFSSLDALVFHAHQSVTSRWFIRLNYQHSTRLGLWSTSSCDHNITYRSLHEIMHNR